MTDFRPPGPPFFVRLIATGFFSGYSGFAPGTAGSGVALAIYCLLPPLNSWAWGLLLVGLFFLGVYTSGACEKAWGKDPVCGFFYYGKSASAVGIDGYCWLCSVSHIGYY
ncbi:MAG: phosphatidylglycerophosphatase A [Candidatus Latescibacteria bacterium]|nr:phosphatidylglycerophosphatase A [Candidatus Latescibacterota bacterium]